MNDYKNNSKMAEVLYFDNQVTIYRDLIVINKYFFPLATSKHIMIKDIETISIVNSEGVNHRWGITPKHLNNWFPLDGDRKMKTKFIEIRIKGKKTRPSITPVDPDAVFNIIWQNYTSDGKKYVEEVVSSRRESEKDTEMCQQEMMERKEAETNEVKAERSSNNEIEVENLD